MKKALSILLTCLLLLTTALPAFASGLGVREKTGAIVIADDQDHNRLIANADLWFGCAVRSAAAAATSAAKGIIKVGTAA